MTVRVAVVGAGKMGAHHARVFARSVRFVGAYDVDAARTDAVVRAYGGACLASIDEAIDRADLVVVATPTPLHFDDAMRALSAGRHVLVEKPLCATESDAWALCELARSSGAMLFVGHSERFNPLVRTVARATRDQPLVELVTRRVVGGASRLDEPCLNLAVHDIDLASFLSGGAVQLESAVAAGSIVELTLRMADGLARLTVGYGTSARTMTARTTTHSITGNLALAQCVDEEPLDLQAYAVLAAIAGHASAVARGDDGARAVSIAKQASSALLDAPLSAAE